MIRIMLLATYITLRSSAVIGGKSTTDAACGVSPISPDLNGLGRIVGGSEAAMDSWPWMCLFKFKASITEKYEYCGAVVLDSTTLITAAHCRPGPISQTNETNANGDTPEETGSDPLGLIACGIHYTHTDSPHDRKYRQEFDLPDYEFRPHENYGKPSPQNYECDYDIAILKLKTKQLTMDTPAVKAVCLPGKDVYDPTLTICYATGWGYTTTDPTKQQISDPLMQVREYITPGDKECHAKGNRNSPRDFCAFGKRGHDICQGDSGGPLVCKRGNVWEVQGITSCLYSPCGDRPSSFSRVFKYLDWIKDHRK